MKNYKITINLSLTVVLSLMSYSQNLLFNDPPNVELPSNSIIEHANLSESLSASGDILGYYTDLLTTNPIVDVVSFSKLNGNPPVALSTPLTSINSTLSSLFLPSCGSAFDFVTEDLACLVSGNEVLLAYNDNPPSPGAEIDLSPLSPAAPQFLNNSLYGILINNPGYLPGTVDIEIVNNIQTGVVDGIMPYTFTPVPGYYFNHEQTSSATNGSDEIYFVSGTSLLIFNNSIPFNPATQYLDLGPSNLFFYHGLEYKSPGILWALRMNHINPSLELVEINITGGALQSITSIYDLQTNVAPAPAGWIVNGEYYSTTLDTCNMRYYITSLYDDMIGNSRLIEIDVPLNQHFEQINARYLFGIEITDLACEPCSLNLTSNFVDSCGHVQILSNSPGALDYSWCSGENTANLDLQLPCGTYDYCISVTCADGTVLTDAITIVVSDNSPPNIVCPPHLNLKCDDDLTPAFTGTATATDNCPIIDPLSYADDTLFMIPCDGLIERTWMATDWCGNTSSCIQNIVVHDNVPPFFVDCPSDVTLYGTVDSMGVCSANLVIGDPMASDNCSSAVTITNNINGSGNVSGTYPAGSTTIIWTATDSCMNTAVWNTVITVLCDTCTCVGFDSLQFFMPSGTNVPGFNLPVTCGNMPPITLPCIPNDGLYQFSGNFQCSDSCAAQVNYEIISLDDGSVSSGYVITYPTGGSNYHFDFISGFNGPPGNYQLELTGSCNADTCLCIINFIIPPCEDCECGSYTDINYRPVQGAPNINAMCGDTLIAQCEGGIPWTLNGNFQCSGTTCPDSTHMSWILTRPDGSVMVDSIVARPFFNVFIPSFAFDSTGFYQLSIQAICGQDTCVCDFVIEVECVGCCSDRDTFCAVFESEVNIIVDDPYCKATLDIGDLGPCNNFVEYIEWGDSQVDTGPFGSNTMVMHNYAGSGTYEIKWGTYQLDDAGNLCHEKQFIDTIYVNCPASICCTDEDEFSARILDNIEFVVDDANKSVDLVIGDINECDSISIRTWGDPHVPEPKKWGKGARVSYQYMDCGNYDIEFLAEAHENDTTICVEKLFVNPIEVQCTDCPCDISDIQALSNAVDLGFATISSSIDCKVCLAPLSLSDCEIVEWYEDNLNTLSLGTTSGKQTFCYDFINSGNYNIIMLVTRYKPDGSICEVFTKSQIVSVNCNTYSSCEFSEIPNSGFNEGALPGGLNPGGMGNADGWRAAIGEPIVEEGAMGSLDGWTIDLASDTFKTDVLTTIDPICPMGNSDEEGVSVRFGIKENGIKSTIAIDFYRGDNYELPDSSNWNPIRCLRLASIDLEPLEENIWYNLKIPYDIGEWIDLDTCGIRPALHTYTPPSGNFSTARRVLQIDEFCFGRASVAVDELENNQMIRLFPNPTTGQLTIRFEGALPGNTQLQILDLLGRIVQTEKLIYGNRENKISLNMEIPGVYFINVLNEKGIPLLTEKIIKQ